MSYNELGQLTSKARSKNYESQIFRYNIRGWLTRLGCEVFNEDLYYEKTSTGGQGCYNGNISQSRMEWMVGDLASDNWYMTEAYDYRSLLFNHTYNQLSRLTNTTSTDGFSKFGEAMTYDKHGNIRTINRGGIYQHGWNYIYPNHTYGIIDNMTLSYNGNQLENAIDLASDPLYYGSQDFKDTTATNPGTEYHYDTNGNLTDDSNKGIVTIRSNWLNLPDTVQMENGDMASYTYSPSGDKFMCIYSTVNTSTVTMPLGTTLSNGRPPGITVAQSLFMLYMDNVVYEGNPWSTTLHNLSKVLTDDGILVRTNSVTQATPVFERNYYIRDHLGNVRVVFDSQGRVRQLNNYTPFGMEYGESAGNQASVGYQDYKFGGKELDRHYELNWYNFGARSYDLALGRWTSPDPLAEKYYSVSPYVYCANNPVVLIDPNGMDWVEDKNGNIIWDKKYTVDNVPEGFKYIGTEYQGISINKFFKFTSESGIHKLVVDIGFKEHGLRDDSYNWIQTVERDESGDPFVDYDWETAEGRANYPYYQDKDENKRKRNEDGYDIKYFDAPEEIDNNGSFNAELSLIGDPVGIQCGNQVFAPNSGRIGKIIYAPKITLNYKFSVSNGNMQIYPIRIATPSRYHKQIINSIR